MDTAPRVLALSYYDGATSGFLNGFNDSHVYFFKVVAWDKEQNRRLYVLGRVDVSLLTELLDILAAAGRTPAGPVWVPKWSFGDSRLEANANHLVRAALQSLERPTYLAVGEDLQNSTILQPTAKAMARAIEMVGGSEPGDLEAWLKNTQ